LPRLPSGDEIGLTPSENRCSNLGENYIWGGVKVGVKNVAMGSWQNGVYMFSF